MNNSRSLDNMVLHGWCILVLLVIGTVFAQAQSETDPTNSSNQKEAEVKIIKRINAIEVKGLREISYQSVIGKMQSKPDGVYSLKMLEEDIRRLIGSDLFLSVEWNIEDLPGDLVKIVISVKESGIIKRIVLKGLKNFREASIIEILSVKKNSYFAEFQVKNDIKVLTEKYLEAGFHFIDISHQLNDYYDGLELLYNIREGPQVKVKRVVFYGNTAFPVVKTLSFSKKSQLHDQMSQSSGNFKEKQLIMDIERLKSFYRDRGWLDANIFLSEVKFNKKKNRVIVKIGVEEGERYKIGKFSVSGNAALKSEEISKTIKSTENNYYQLETILSDINGIKTQYGELGYIDCHVEIKTYVPKQSGVIDLSYNIIEGVPSYLSEVKFVGNDKTRDKVLRREMKIFPGNLMEYGLIGESLEQTVNTRYFSDLNYEIEDGYLPNNKNLLIKIQETTTGMMNFGGGYSSNYGLTGIIEINQTNFDLANPPKSFAGFFTSKSFAGGGQQLRLMLQPGIKTSQYSIDFVEPYVFNNPLELNFNLFGFRRTWIDYDENRDGGSFTLAHRLSDAWKIGAGPRMENIQISGIQPDAPVTIRDLGGDNRIQSFTYFIEQDTRDRSFIPHSGVIWRLSEEYAGRFLGGNFDFTKTVFNGDAFQTLITTDEEKKVVLNLSLKIGQIERYDDTETLPFFEKFYAGGFDSIRGFRFHTISPKIDNTPIGGKIMSVFNGEITYPLYSQQIAGRQMEMLRLALFYDVGNVVDRWSELKPESFRAAVGYGFRLQIGMIPISLDFGRPVTMQDGDEIQRFQFNLGYNF